MCIQMQALLFGFLLFELLVIIVIVVFHLWSGVLMCVFKLDF